MMRTNQIGKYAVTYEYGHVILHDGNFKYWLSDEEIDDYTKLYLEHNGKMDIRMFDHFVTQHFIGLHQDTMNKVRNKINRKGNITRKEISELILTTEQELAEASDYPYLTTENERRRGSFLRDICNIRYLQPRITDL